MIICAGSSQRAQRFARPVPTQPEPHAVQLPLACYAGTTMFKMVSRPTEQHTSGGHSSTLELTDGGTWTIVDASGTYTGCLAPGELQRLHAELARAPWNI